MITKYKYEVSISFYENIEFELTEEQLSRHEASWYLNNKVSLIDKHRIVDNHTVEEDGSLMIDNWTINKMEKEEVR